MGWPIRGCVTFSFRKFIRVRQRMFFGMIGYYMLRTLSENNNKMADQSCKRAKERLDSKRTRVCIFQALFMAFLV